MRVQSSTLNQYNTNYYEKSSKSAGSNEKSSANNVDSYVPLIDTGTSGTYSKTSTSKYISQSLMDTINSDISKEGLQAFHGSKLQGSYDLNSQKEQIEYMSEHQPVVSFTNRLGIPMQQNI